MGRRFFFAEFYSEKSNPTRFDKARPFAATALYMYIPGEITKVKGSGFSLDLLLCVNLFSGTKPGTAVRALAFAFQDDKVMLVKPKRGWGLPGGHREGDETSEDCVRREADEEAAIELGDLKLIGRWKIEKQFPSAFNAKYPDLACQLLYVAEITQIKPFSSEYEVTERALVPFTDVARYI